MEKPKCNFTKGTPPSQAVGNGLGKWLTPQQIDALKSCVATYKKITQAIKTEPSFVDEKRQLDRAGKLALELALILGDAGPDLDEVFHFQMGGFEQVAVLKKQLESLSDAIENKLFQMPTQSRARRDDAREDIYALGVTLLELLNRGHPWTKFTGDALEEAKRHRTLPIGLDEPTWLIEIALRAIHPEAALRFQTAADMAAALRGRSVPVSVDRNAMKSHRAVLAGEQALKRGSWHKAEKAVGVALRLSPRLPSAVLLAGRIKLLQHQTDAAYDILKDAVHGPSGNLMGLELGWLHLQRGELPMALSTLSDEVTRNPLNIEAHSLLLECYWTVRRFDEMKRLAEVLRVEKCDNPAIENAGLLARMGLHELDAAWLKKQLARVNVSPFSIYNVRVALAGPQALGGWDCLLEKLLFQEYRFGLPTALKPTNTVVIEYRGNKMSFADKLISIGKLTANSLLIDAPSASRRHAVIVNMGNEVWLHDLHSTVGTWLDGTQIHGKRPLMGVHDVRIGNAPLRVWSGEDLIA